MSKYIEIGDTLLKKELIIKVNIYCDYTEVIYAKPINNMPNRTFDFKNNEININYLKLCPNIKYYLHNTDDCIDIQNKYVKLLWGRGYILLFLII